jgi:hypothetical protein
MPDPKTTRVTKRNMSTPLSPSQFDAYKKKVSKGFKQTVNASKKKTNKNK